MSAGPCAYGIVALTRRRENRHGDFSEQVERAFRIRFCVRRNRGPDVRTNLDFGAWVEWIRSLDIAWLFLLILPFVVLVVGLWSRSLKSGEGKESQHDGSRS